MVFRQGGAADRLFRGSFAGVALSGGGRARKKSEKHRGPCGESGARDRLRSRGIIGICRPRFVAIGLCRLGFARLAQRTAPRGSRVLLLPTRTYSYLLGLTLTYSCPFLRDPGISTAPRDVSSFLAGMREGVVLGRVVGTGAMPREDALVDEASQGRPGELGASSEMVG